MKMTGNIFLSGFFLLISLTATAQEFSLQQIPASTKAYFRALSVVDDQVAWVSGSQGTVGRTIDGGKTWRFLPTDNFEKLEFRSLFAFDSLRAVIANAGSPAYVLHTTDGGKNWITVYTNSHPDAFIDGMDFWNEQEGMIYGDAIEGRMLLLRTQDGGLRWEETEKNSRPALNEGEGSFAASGTGIRCVEKKFALIATGGKTSRLWISSDKGLKWEALNPPVIQGSTMTGIFSLAFHDRNNWIIVGGNYEVDSLKTDHVFYTRDKGKTWIRPLKPTRGMRECVEFIDEKTVISCGLNGIDLSDNGGVIWRPLSDERQFAVVRKARKGSLVVLAGAQGKMAILRTRP
jgi:photosystem II stability/assembly factor-like uncharacterized protein